MLVDHARSYRTIVGDPLYDPNRHARVQRLYWNADGTPNFGVPVGDCELPVRLEPASALGTFLAHDGATVTATEGSSSAFLQRGGLSDAAGASFESVDFPGSYLVLRQGAPALAKVGKNERPAATFFLRS